MDRDIDKNFGQLSPRAVIEAINLAGYRTIGEVRARLHTLVPELALLENAPTKDVPQLVRVAKTGSLSSSQALLPFATPLVSHVTINGSLQYSTGVLAANATRLHITVCLLASVGESGEKQARITPEGEELITALTTQRLDYRGGMSASEVKYISTIVLRNHLLAQAKEMRKRDHYGPFDHWSEVDIYLRQHCGYLYCLGNIFPMYSCLLGQYPEQVVCFGDPHKRERGLIIARRDLTSGQIGFTPAGKACIRYYKSHHITGSPNYDYVLGSTMRRAISNCQNRGRCLAAKVESSAAEYGVLQFSSLDEAEVRLRQLPALQNLPLYRGKDFIGIKHKGKKIFRLVSPLWDKFVERPELSVLLADVLQVSLYLDELALLAQFENRIAQNGQRKKGGVVNRIEKQKTRIINRLLSFLEDPQAPRPEPKQIALNFGKSSA